jgi:polyisoprenoid-binding protein YceI
MFMRQAHENLRRGGAFRRIRSLLRVHLPSYFLYVSIAFATDENSHQKTVVLKPEATAIHWTLSGNMHTVHGTFELKRAVMDLNLEDGSVDGLVEVNATSGQSGNTARDQRMQSILESDRYPIISFHPTKVIGRVMPFRDEVVTVEGIFRIHGADHPLQMQINIHPKGTAIILKTEFAVPYVDWGMEDPSILFFRVDRTVNIEVEATVRAGD